MNKDLAVGIDIGGTNTKFGIVDRHGIILEQDRMRTDDFENAEDFIEALHGKLRLMMANHGGNDHFKGIGVGAPNGNYYTGTIEYAPNLKWKGIIPVADMMEKKFGVPTKLTNDANAAAVGEMMYGVAKGMKHFITITLGTGVGSGIVIDGKIVLGHDGFAGWFCCGHLFFGASWFLPRYFSAASPFLWLFIVGAVYMGARKLLPSGPS